jgi:hypothetical protein
VGHGPRMHPRRGPGQPEWLQAEGRAGGRAPPARAVSGDAAQRPHLGCAPRRALAGAATAAVYSSGCAGGGHLDIRPGRGGGSPDAWDSGSPSVAAYVGQRPLSRPGSLPKTQSTVPYLVYATLTARGLARRPSRPCPYPACGGAGKAGAGARAAPSVVQDLRPLAALEGKRQSCERGSPRVGSIPGAPAFRPSASLCASTKPTPSASTSSREMAAGSASAISGAHGDGHVGAPHARAGAAAGAGARARGRPRARQSATRRAAGAGRGGARAGGRRRRGWRAWRRGRHGLAWRGEILIGCGRGGMRLVLTWLAALRIARPATHYCSPAAAGRGRALTRRRSRLWARRGRGHERVFTLLPNGSQVSFWPL